MNVLTPIAREVFLAGDLSWRDDTFKVVLLDLTVYTFNAGHDFLDDVPSGARLGISAALTGKTFAGGVADADDTSFTGVTLGSPNGQAFWVYHEGASDAASHLVCYGDRTADGTPLLVVPDGNAIPLTWNAAGIFKL